MIFEVALLALASTVRPTSLAAMSALLGRESRLRLMAAYVAVGLAFTVLFGLVVVGVFHGVHIEAGTSRTKAIADIIGGVVALLFGCAVLAGKVRRAPTSDAEVADRGWMARLDRQITVRVAAVAGPLTHIPGIFYLIALNVIVADSPRFASGLLAVGVYNGIWFALPLAALVLCIVNPDLATRLVMDVQKWAKRHSQKIILLTSFVVGALLVIRGVLAL
jgi:hypothetical protein